jgi:diketogulonate reductase-like aldo/keto reductase
MVNQFHFHPMHTAKAVRAYCKQHAIVMAGLFDENELVKQTKPLYFTDVKESGELFETNEERRKANLKAVFHCPNMNPDFFAKSETGYEVDPIRRECNPRLQRDYYEYFHFPGAISKIAKKYNKTNAQVCIRWSLQHGVVTTPKTIKRKKMEEFADVFDFELTQVEMDAIDSLNADFRIGYNPNYIDF